MIWPNTAYESGQQPETDCTCSQVERVSRSQPRTDAKFRPPFNIFKEWPTRALHQRVTCSNSQAHGTLSHRWHSILWMLPEEKWPLYFSAHDRCVLHWSSFHELQMATNPLHISAVVHCIDHILMNPLNFVTDLFDINSTI